MRDWPKNFTFLEKFVKKRAIFAFFTCWCGEGARTQFASTGSPSTQYSCITNNKAKNGGGIYAESGPTIYLGYSKWTDGGTYANSYTTIYMGGGQISKNSASNFGGGVYTAGALFMYGSALIGDTNTSTTNTTESSYGYLVNK